MDEVVLEFYTGTEQSPQIQELFHGLFPFRGKLAWSDRIRTLKIIAPFLILFYCLILKGGLLDGWRGWYYAFQRLLAELLLSLRLIEQELHQD